MEVPLSVREVFDAMRGEGLPVDLSLQAVIISRERFSNQPSAFNFSLLDAGTLLASNSLSLPLTLSVNLRFCVGKSTALQPYRQLSTRALRNHSFKPPNFLAQP